MILIKGGLIRPITSPDIENGEILIDNGKIVAIGKDVGRNLADVTARNRELCGRKAAIRRTNAYLKGLRGWKG